ncbi:hypothetical protein R9X47_24110 [Wukongibacter baidiensis]|uniref:DUF6897 domain-containing protein n=1 Tax=Wukongibacter baidiensis TaxID=1723361 RepID=UPI003D7F370D
MSIADIIRNQFQGVDVEINTLGGFTFTGTVSDGSDDLVVLNNGGVLTTIQGEDIVAFRPL